MKDKKLGRPVTLTGAKRVLITADADTITKARIIGSGNLSAGVRLAVKAFRDRWSPPSHN